MLWVGSLLLLLLSSTTQAQRTWFQQLPPPASFFQPDIDVSSPSPLPRVPPSPYGLPANICPAGDGVPYAVAGFPGTPYIITPFTSIYRSPVDAQPTATVWCHCRPAGWWVAVTDIQGLWHPKDVLELL